MYEEINESRDHDELILLIDKLIYDRIKYSLWQIFDCPIFKNVGDSCMFTLYQLGPKLGKYYGRIGTLELRQRNSKLYCSKLICKGNKNSVNNQNSFEVESLAYS